MTLTFSRKHFRSSGALNSLQILQRLHRHYNTQCRGHLFVSKQKRANGWTGPQTTELEKIQHACTLKKSTV